jgi:hypothetical protein
MNPRASLTAGRHSAGSLPTAGLIASQPSPGLRVGGSFLRRPAPAFNGQSASPLRSGPVTRALILILALFIGGEASAQPACAPRDELIALLVSQYSETVVGAGIDTRGTFAEVYASPDGSWTVVTTTPDGMSCMIASGQGWESYPAGAPT